MLASELIAKLQELIAEHGDAKVTIPDVGCGCCGGGPVIPARVEYMPEEIRTRRISIEGKRITRVVPAQYHLVDEGDTL